MRKTERHQHDGGDHDRGEKDAVDRGVEDVEVDDVRVEEDAGRVVEVLVAEDHREQRPGSRRGG